MSEVPRHWRNGLMKLPGVREVEGKIVLDTKSRPPRGWVQNELKRRKGSEKIKIEKEKNEGEMTEK